MTIYDVAAAAGVSHQTIANVLANPARVAPGTRAHVERHIAELGFRPNRTAQNLSRRRSGLIAFRVQARSSLATGGILDEFLQALAESAEAIDHHIVLYHSAPGVDEVDKAVDLYRANVADAFVIAETHPGDPRIPALVDAGLRFVTFGRTDGTVDHTWVDTDNIAGSRLATAHLLELGHTTVGFVGWPGNSWVGADRLEGWRRELGDRGVPADDSLIAIAVNDRTEAAAACGRMLTNRPDVTAIVAASDELGLGVQIAARRAGRTISVVGYDDSPMAAIGDGLTTVRQPIPEIARRLLEFTAHLIADDSSPPIHERIVPQLVVRGSSAAI